MKPSPVSLANAHPVHQKNDDAERGVTPEMRKAADGLEAIFAGQMMEAMRGTVGETSEFSLHNTATDLYQGMLDQEYAEIAAKHKSLGLSEQIIDYWLRTQPQTKYNESTGPKVGSVRTGGTNEGQSSE